MSSQAADRRALRAPVGDGRDQRHARLVLGRRRAPRAPARRSRRRARMLDDGAAIVDVGGESTRPGSDGVPLDEELRRVVPVLEALAGAAGLDRHGEGRGRAPGARARRRARERRDGAARRPRARGRRRGGGRVRLPDAHARRAADDAGATRSTTTSSREVKAFLEERLGVRGRGGDPRGARLPRPRDRVREDGRAQPRAVRRLGELVALGRPVLVGFSRKSTARPGPRRPVGDRRHARRRRSARRSRRSTAARRSSAPTTSASTSRRCASRGRSPAR